MGYVIVGFIMLDIGLVIGYRLAVRFHRPGNLPRGETWLGVTEDPNGFIGRW